MKNVNILNDALFNGAQIVIQTLEELGVETCFAYPGGAAVEFHQALADSSVRVVLPRHEQGGAFAASGYARACGKVGVCMATSGPGATNLLTGIADAYMDSIPVVVITGQVESWYIGKNAFQEIDIIGMTRPIVKHSYLVFDASEIRSTIIEAFELARSGRPGPVWIDIPKDVQKTIPETHRPPVCRVHEHSVLGCSSKVLQQIKNLIATSERPCIYAGGGVIAGGASGELVRFAESYRIPVVTSLMGIGAFPETHPLSLKFLGMHGTYYANYAANECDLLLAFGARFSDRSTGRAAAFARGAKMIHVDIDESELNKNISAEICVAADIKTVLSALNESPVFKRRTVWFKTIERWKTEYPLTYLSESGKLKAQEVVETLYRMTGGEAVIVPGVGQHQMWAAQFFKYTRPRQFLTSGGLGTMGYGLPAAMGVKLALPDATVINIDGDGSFQMNIQELGTLSAEEIGVKIVILNNQHLGMVAQIEDMFYRGKRGNTELRGKSGKPFPCFSGIARSYEIPARDVFRIEELEDAVREMLETPGPFLLDCHTVYQDYVLPMIPSGKTYRDIITE